MPRWNLYAQSLHGTEVENSLDYQETLDKLKREIRFAENDWWRIEKKIQEGKNLLQKFEEIHEHKRVSENLDALNKEIEKQKLVLQTKKDELATLNKEIRGFQTNSQCIIGLLELLRRNESELSCSVCYEGDFTPDNIHVTSCSHIFHSTCISEWYATSSRRKCPYCKQRDTNTIKTAVNDSEELELDITDLNIVNEPDEYSTDEDDSD